MDITKQNRNLVITIIVLVIINFAALLLLWLGKPKHDIKQGPRNGGNEIVRIQEMLKEELGFSTEQAEKFIKLRENHHKKSIELHDELIIVKRKMFEEAMYGDKSVISDSLLNLSLEKQSQLELLTFQHFLKLKQICTPEQQKKLFKIVNRLLGQTQQGGPPPNNPRGELKDDMPHPPPQGKFREGHSPPPNRN